ncbi:MAG: SDR family oxidoreductase [Gemmatimonadetes bacterium]|nr:SDR family oxidoreductase [Gemmatimonadota bacterium]
MESRIAVVTGAGRGIGAAVARELASAGARVVLASRTLAPATAVAEEITAAGGRALALRCDVTGEADVALLAADLAERVGPADILVNNAGAAHAAPLERTTLDDWERMLAVNATGTFLMTRALLPAMIARGFGRVVNVASVAALEGGRYISAYAAAKHAVLGFTRSVAEEVRGTGVTVNAVCPGYVDTDLTRESVRRIVEKTGRSEADARRLLAQSNAGGELLAPEDVAREVLRLCGKDAGDVQGQAIRLEEAGRRT